ncbi:Arginine/serine-rich protein PNISR [Trichinella spiralis]|uniref:Arginine/serine-rich protein PNISR n=1 Tax=Trichinella spiralis TaxID=6334 RepID=A0ABR3KI04_TRISP
MPMVPPPPMLPPTVPQAAQSSSSLASVAGQPRNWTVMQLAPVGDHVQFSATHLQQMVRMGVPICGSSTSVILDGALQMEATQKKKLPEWLREGLVKITQMKETEPSPVPPPSEKSAFKDDDENNRHSLPKCNFSVGLISSEDESELENDESALQMATFIQQEVTRILLSVTHEKTVSICTKVLKEEKSKAIPKLLMQSQALSLLQNLGDDDEDDDETANKKEKYAKSTDKTNRKKWKRMSKNSEKVKNNCDADMLPQNELLEKSQDRRDIRCSERRKNMERWSHKPYRSEKSSRHRRYEKSHSRHR